MRFRARKRPQNARETVGRSDSLESEKEQMVWYQIVSVLSEF